MVRRHCYPSDLTDREWAVLRLLIPGKHMLGRPPRYSKRSIVNAIFYLVRSGCAWRMLPHDLPPWRICYFYFMTWKKEGVWIKIHNHLRDKLRLGVGKKKPRPLRLSTRKVLNLLTTPEAVDMMQASGSWVERDTYSWTHLA
jgi:putative transposase